MNPRLCPCKGRCGGLFFAALLCATGAATAQDCQGQALTPLLGAQRSLWREIDAQGRTLVRERGTLAYAALEGSVRCGNTDWSAQWRHGQGERDYDGVTNTHGPLRTSSAVSDDELGLSAMAQRGERWALGARLGYRQLQRRIDSTDKVQGFPERYRYGQAALGARYQTQTAGHLQVGATVWLAAGPGGSVRVQWPDAQALTLPLGPSLAVEARLQVGSTPAERPNWCWRMGLNWRGERLGAGASRELLRNAGVAGTAAQPQTRQLQAVFDAGLSRAF